MQVEILDR